MKKLVYYSMVAVWLFSVMVVAHSFASDDWEYKGVGVSNYNPDVKHYAWETARPPYGPWDMITLNRFVKESNNRNNIPNRPARDLRKVLFFLPGTWDRGSTTIQDPKISLPWFFAENGYDVYTISFRTEYIPNYAYDQFSPFGLVNALKATAGWTYGVFREDIKACLEKAKTISRARKLFMAGKSRGGTQMWIYAAKYAEDLKTLVSFDGGGAYVNVNPSAQMTKAAFDATVAALGTSSGLPYLSEVDNYDLHQFSGAVPFATTGVGAPLPDIKTLNPPIPSFAPADKNRMTYVSDLTAYKAYWLWGAGLVCNYYAPYPGGNGETYIDQNILTAVEALLTRYWPNIQTLEGNFMANYLVNPYLDYLNPNINLPVIFFASELSCPKGSCLSLPSTYQARTQSNDITTIYLPKYGHLDVFSGSHSLQDVKEPALEWMNDRLR
jgi:pimeloyl-ACP methyl ester carboxylesterase